MADRPIAPRIARRPSDAIPEAELDTLGLNNTDYDDLLRSGEIHPRSKAERWERRPFAGVVLDPPERERLRAAFDALVAGERLRPVETRWRSADAKTRRYFERVRRAIGRVYAAVDDLHRITAKPTTFNARLIALETFGNLGELPGVLDATLGDAGRNLDVRRASSSRGTGGWKKWPKREAHRPPRFFAFARDAADVFCGANDGKAVAGPRWAEFFARLARIARERLGVAMPDDARSLAAIRRAAVTSDATSPSRRQRPPS